MPFASLFNLEAPDLLVILVIVLLLFGAKQLPPLVRGIGEAVRGFRRTLDEITGTDDRQEEPSTPVKPSNLLPKLLVIVALVVVLLSLASRLAR